MRRPNLNALQMFDAAARHLNFRLAAEELNLTQGAVAQQVRKLEAQLGQPLFTRLPRGLALTDSGATYAKAVARAFALLDDATAKLAPSGRVTLSVPPSLATKWLVPRLAQFTKQHPEIDLQIIASETPTRFPSTEVDLAIRQGPRPDDATLCVEPLPPQALIAVCAPGVAAPATTLADFQPLPLIEDGHRSWQHLFDKCGLIAPDRILRFNQTALAMDAAANGQGIALAPEILVSDDLAKGRLIPLWRTEEQAAAFHILRAAQPASAALAIVVRWLKTQIKGSAEPAPTHH